MAVARGDAWRMYVRECGNNTQRSVERSRAMPLTEYFPNDVIENLRRMTTLLVSQGKLPLRLSLTASLRREGVTHTTLALGAVLANDLNKRVCLVELNWAAPGMYAQCLRIPVRGLEKWNPLASFQQPVKQLPLQKGIGEVLLGKAHLNDVLNQTVVPNLTVLSAGEIPDHQQPLIARSAALQTLIEELGQRFDHVILDIPAILPSSDAIALISLSEACCLVIRQGVTHLNMVRRALDDIKHFQVIGTILNRVQIHTPRLIRNFVPEE
jgi:hypothetical protein